MGLGIPIPTIFVTFNTWELCHSERVVVQPNKFMYLGESFKVSIEEHKTDLIDYWENKG